MTNQVNDLIYLSLWKSTVGVIARITRVKVGPDYGVSEGMTEYWFEKADGIPMPNDAYQPTRGEHVEGFFINGKMCVGTYLEKSANEGHYVMDRDGKTIVLVVDVGPLPRHLVSIEQLIHFYATQNKMRVEDIELTTVK